MQGALGLNKINAPFYPFQTCSRYLASEESRGFFLTLSTEGIAILVCQIQDVQRPRERMTNLDGQEETDLYQPVHLGTEEVTSLTGGVRGFQNGHYRNFLSKDQAAGQRTRDLLPVSFRTGLYLKEL